MALEDVVGGTVVGVLVGARHAGDYLVSPEVDVSGRGRGGMDFGSVVGLAGLLDQRGMTLNGRKPRRGAGGRGKNSVGDRILPLP